MTDTSIITIISIVTIAILVLAYMGRRLRLRIERRGIWLIWERARKSSRAATTALLDKEI